MRGVKIAKLIQESNSRDAVLSTTYEDNEISKGNCYQIKKRITLASEETLKLCFDFSQTDKVIYSMPVIKVPNQGNLFTDTYFVDSVADGSTYDTPLNMNANSSNTAETPVKTGVTETGDQQFLREYTDGSPITNQASGGGTFLSDRPKILPNKPLIIYFQNQETEEMVIDFNYNWYEI